MKKSYSSPKLAVFGTVENLTKGLGFGRTETIFSKDIL